MACPVCGDPLPPPKPTGRPRIYCKDKCKRKVERAKARLPWLKKEAQVWRDRHKTIGSPGYRDTAEEIEAEVRKLESILKETA